MFKVEKMKTRHLIMLAIVMTHYFVVGQSTRFEFNASESLTGSKMIVEDQDVYFTFHTESSNIYTTYLAKWDIKTEKILWCKKISINNNISILPVKIIRLSNGTFVLGATDYAFSNGFMNGNYTFIQFNQNGEILRVIRLGSATGGQLRDIMDDGDNILFLGDRINVESAYRTILGRLDKDLNVVTMKSVSKEYYTYGNAIRKDKSGNVYTVGFTRPVIGSRRALVTKWRPDLSHEKSLIQEEEDPNTAFNHLFIDEDNSLHIGGNFGNLATYVHLDNNLNYLYGHEFNSGNVQNIWQDNNGKMHIFIEGPNYFVSVDKSYNIRFEAKYLNSANPSAQYVDDTQNIYTYEYSNTPDNPVNKLHLMKHEYKQDRECFLNTISGDFNGPLRRDSFGIAQGLEIRNESMTQVVPNDITVSNFDITVREICRIDDVSRTKDKSIDKIIIFPNPAQDRVTAISHYDSEIFEVSIYNLQGNKVYSQSKVSSGTILDISGISSGFYTILFQTEYGKPYYNKLTIVK